MSVRQRHKFKPETQEEIKTHQSPERRIFLLKQVQEYLLSKSWLWINENKDTKQKWEPTHFQNLAEILNLMKINHIGFKPQHSIDSIFAIYQNHVVVKFDENTILTESNDNAVVDFVRLWGAKYKNYELLWKNWSPTMTTYPKTFFAEKPEGTFQLYGELSDETFCTAGHSDNISVPTLYYESNQLYFKKIDKKLSFFQLISWIETLQVGLSLPEKAEKLFDLVFYEKNNDRDSPKAIKNIFNNSEASENLLKFYTGYFAEADFLDIPNKFDKDFFDSYFDKVYSRIPRTKKAQFAAWAEKSQFFSLETSFGTTILGLTFINPKWTFNMEIFQKLMENTDDTDFVKISRIESEQFFRNSCTNHYKAMLNVSKKSWSDSSAYGVQTLLMAYNNNNQSVYVMCKNQNLIQLPTWVDENMTSVYPKHINNVDYYYNDFTTSRWIGNQRNLHKKRKTN